MMQPEMNTTLLSVPAMNWLTKSQIKRNFLARCFANCNVGRWTGNQGRGHNKQGNPLLMNLIPGATRLKRTERRTILSFAKLNLTFLSIRQITNYLILTPWLVSCSRHRG